MYSNAQSKNVLLADILSQVMENTREVRLLFVPGKVLDYAAEASPDFLPVWFDGREIGKAIYFDYHYCFNIPEQLAQTVDQGMAAFRFVFGHPLSGEAYGPRPGSKLIRIQIEETAPAPKPRPEDANNILEL
jgi:hypothetical protein